MVVVLRTGLNVSSVLKGSLCPNMAMGKPLSSDALARVLACVRGLLLASTFASTLYLDRICGRSAIRDDLRRLKDRIAGGGVPTTSLLAASSSLSLPARSRPTSSIILSLLAAMSNGELESNPPVMTLRFPAGLPRWLRSKSTLPSPRFIGLDLLKRGLAMLSLDGVKDKLNGDRDWSIFTNGVPAGSIGLLSGEDEFSCPVPRYPMTLTMDGQFPWSFASLKARRNGVLDGVFAGV